MTTDSGQRKFKTEGTPEGAMTTPKKYRKKPVAIEAMQWDGTAEGATPIIDWILAHDGTARYVGQGEEHYLRYDHEREMKRNRSDGQWYHTGPVLPDAPAFLIIDTPEGAHRQDAHDFTVKGVKCEFYPVKPDIFKETYEAVQ